MTMRNELGGPNPLELDDDLPPRDHVQAARDLSDVFLLNGANMDELAQQIGLPDTDPAFWLHLDVARAAAHARSAYPSDFERVAANHPWLNDSADESSDGALAEGF